MGGIQFPARRSRFTSTSALRYRRMRHRHTDLLEPKQQVPGISFVPPKTPVHLFPPPANKLLRPTAIHTAFLRLPAVPLR